MSKKLILILIDSFLPQIFSEASVKGLVPTLSTLASYGAFWDNCVSIFPTVSVTADASLLMGSYPDAHKIAGLSWYSSKEKRIVNYYSSLRAAWSLGITQSAEDTLVNLNESHLNKSIETIFEELENRGKMVGSINFAVHRGLNKQKIRKPGFMRWILYKMPQVEVSIPSTCSFGKFITSYGLSPPWKINQSFFKKYGLNDSFAIDIACMMVKNNTLPNFTLVYLPDNDYSYERKPENGAQILGKVDKQINRLMQSFGSIEKALSQCRFIITGDHGQSKIHNEPNAVIQVEELFKGMRICTTRLINMSDHDLVVCNNYRMCYFYPLHEKILQSIVNRLASESKRIDIVAWKYGAGVSMVYEGRKLFFYPAIDEQKTSEGKLVQDLNGKLWVIYGEIPVCCKLHEIVPNSPLRITFMDYPDLFSRLYGALYANDGQVVVATSALGYEFGTNNEISHRGRACHGSLHKIDSFVPLIITDENKDKFFAPRIVDLKNYVINNLNESS